MKAWIKEQLTLPDPHGPDVFGLLGLLGAGAGDRAVQGSMDQRRLAHLLN